MSQPYSYKVCHNMADNLGLPMQGDTTLLFLPELRYGKRKLA